mgnify:CR=1 FL=1
MKGFDISLEECDRLVEDLESVVVGAGHRGPEDDFLVAAAHRVATTASAAPTARPEVRDPEEALARLMSGKPDGDYYYRLESASGTDAAQQVVLSDVLKVTVEHHPLERAFAFFAVGAAVFAATLGLILFGGRDERS